MITQSGKTSDLHLLRQACGPIAARLGSKRAQEVARAIVDALAARGMADPAAKEMAAAIAGKEPTAWLTASEAREALTRLGVRTGMSFLYRRSKRAALLASHQQFTIWINRRGQWGPLSEVQKPVAKIHIQKSNGHSMFMVEPIEGDKKSANPCHSSNSVSNHAAR